MKKIIISVVLAALVAAAVFGTFAIQNNSTSEAQQRTSVTEQAETDAPVSNTQPPAPTAPPAAQQSTPPTTTTTTPFADNENGYAQPMDWHCAKLMILGLYDKDEYAVKIGNKSFSLAGTAIEYLNPYEQVNLVSAKGDTGCIIAKILLTDTLPDAEPIGQPIDNFCYQTMDRLNEIPAYSIKTTYPDGGYTIEEVSMTTMIAEMKRNGEALVLADSLWNIGCVYGKNGSIKQIASLNAKPQPIDRYCEKIFKNAAKKYARTITTVTSEGETNTDFYSLLGEVIVNWQVDNSVPLAVPLNGQAGCIIEKSRISEETQTTKKVSNEASEPTVATTTIPSATRVQEPVAVDTTVPTTTAVPPQESQTG